MDMADNTDNGKMQEIIARTWVDEEFKHRLITDPVATLAAEGATIPPGLQIKAVENTDRVFHLVLPLKPTHLSDLELERIAAGGEGAGLAGLGAVFSVADLFR
jgi:hypothetical protein